MPRQKAVLVEVGISLLKRLGVRRGEFNIAFILLCMVQAVAGMWSVLLVFDSMFFWYNAFMLSTLLLTVTCSFWHAISWRAGHAALCGASLW